MPGEAELSFVFYVSGHGLGHLTRCAEVARALLGVNLGASRGVTFVTSVANCEILGTRVVAGQGGIRCALRLSEDGTQVYVRDRQLDAGARQADAFRIDVDETRNGAMAFHRDIDVLVREEAAWLREVRPDVVVSDVVGVAFPAARQAGVPSVLMSNFSWGFIYRPFIREDEDDGAFRSVVRKEEEMLAKAVRIQPQRAHSKAEDHPTRTPRPSPETLTRARSPALVRPTGCVSEVGGLLAV